MNLWTDWPPRRVERHWSRTTHGACLLLCTMLTRAAAAAPPAAEPRDKAAGQTTGPPSTATTRRVRPLVTAQFVDVTIQRRPAGLKVLSQRHGRLSKSARLPRYTGPFELLLYAGKRLRDRLHFSFPLTLGAMEAKGVPDLDRDLARGVSAVTVVRIPYDHSLTHFVVRDLRSRDVTTSGKLRPPAVDLSTGLLGPTRAASFGPVTATGKRDAPASGSKSPRSPPPKGRRHR